MKECLQCGKKFEGKPTKKYCSDSCKVMYCRKNKKTGLSVETKMTILYNNFIEAIDEFRKEVKLNGSPIVIKSESAEIASAVSELPKMKLKRSESYFLTIIRNGFECAEDHIEFIREVNESDLSPTKKEQIIAASRIKQY